MKTIAFYLPQFHSIPENDEWWGKGFTEWVNVKKAKPLFENHFQPRKPLNDNYYNLTDVNVMRWQVDLAKKHGIYGFCFYHYWFDGHMLLEKPVENYLENKDIDFPYCICWANEHWTNAWTSGKNKVLIEQRYGTKTDWKKHFDYLLPFFKDKRYIQKENKPVFIIYRPELIDERKDMLAYWDELAVENGLEGICFMFQRPDSIVNNEKQDLSMFDNCIEYQPYTAFLLDSRKKMAFLKKLKNSTFKFLEKNFKFSAYNGARKKVKKYDYDTIWQSILKQKPLTDNSIPCALVNWDNTPRRGNGGSVLVGMTPEKFKYYFEKLIDKAKNDYKTDWIFVFAWNEWAEGGYLEPDTEHEYKCLEAIKEALIEKDEYPW